MQNRVAIKKTLGKHSYSARLEQRRCYTCYGTGYIIYIYCENASILVSSPLQNLHDDHLELGSRQANSEIPLWQTPSNGQAYTFYHENNS